MNNEETKTYEFRKLCSKDMFPMFNLISKIGIKELKSCFSSDEVMKTISQLSGDKKDDGAKTAVGMTVAIEIANIIFANLPKCENEIYEFLASVSNLKRKELEKMGMGEFFEMIVDLIKQPDFKDFFKVVSKLFK